MRKLIWALGTCAALAACGRSAEPAADTEAPPSAAAASAAEAPVMPAIRVGSLEGFDLVVVVVDSLRADRATAANMPFFDRLSKSGLRFEDAASSSSYVLQSLASFFTGRLPTAGGAIGVYEAEPQEETTTLAQYFERAGYYTGLLANHPAVQGRGFTKGFAEIDVARPDQFPDNARLVQRAAEFLEDAGDDRVFLYVHFAGPTASALYRGGSDEADAPLNVGKFAAEYAASHPPTDARLTATIREYDNAIRAADTQLKALVDAVSVSGRGDETVFLITSMNGFELLDHGHLGAGWTVYEEAIRVPFVLYAPAVVPGAGIAEPVGLIDAMPTMLDLFGLEREAKPLEGRALFAAAADNTLHYQPNPEPRIAELVIPERCIVRSVSKDGWKYHASTLWPAPAARFSVAQAHRETANAYLDGSKPLPPLWGADAYEALFNLRADPYETQSLSTGQAARLSEMQTLLDEYRQRCAQVGIAPRVATQFQSAVDPEQIQNLESLGYL